MTDSQWALQTAARTLWQEARSEAIDGQIAVVHAIINRVKDGRWGDNIAEVCLDRAQFSAWGRLADPNYKPSCTLPDNDPRLIEFCALFAAAEDSPDPTGGATHYYAKIIPPPFWVSGATFCGQFGTQLFYKGVK